MDPSYGEPAELPPADPEQWSDEQWIAWLKATDADAAVERPAPTTVGGRVVRSSGGQALGQAMMGMAKAIYGQRVEEVVIVTAANSEPEKDQPFTLHLDPDHPERSFAVRKSVAEPPA